MAVIETGAIFKSLRFDGIDSREFGVYITGEAVYNAPERDVEMITIPGRNGDYALDKGRFKNITVTYPAGLMQGSAEDFKQAISDFRNALGSRIGYQRLEDDYHPDEYRLAVYKSGLDVTPADFQAGEFSITFECKPQRFLTAGETLTAITSGATLANPTLFEAAPLIEAEGYGQIDLAGAELQVANVPLGNVVLWNPTSKTFPTVSGAQSFARSFDGSLVATGDSLYLYMASFDFAIASSTFISSMSIQQAQGDFEVQLDQRNRALHITVSAQGFTKGTPLTLTEQVILRVNMPEAYDSDVTATLAYDGNQTMTFSLSTTPSGNVTISPKLDIQELDGDSTVNAAGTLYIDTESGLAWWDESGSIVDANSTASLPAELPRLGAGESVVTYDSTFTSFKIAPRWWKI